MNDFFNTLAPKYWEEYKDVVVRITEPGQNPYEKTLERMYQDRANRNNESHRRYNYGAPDETAYSCYLDAIENAALRILDSEYILKYAIMREQTYVLYHYYENNNPVHLCPDFDFFKNGSMIGGISPREWRWWVDEMGY